MKKRHQDGIMPEVWNKGLLASTDVRVAAYARVRVSRIDEEERRKNSEKMQNQWSSGNITPLRGPDHPNWKGGTSNLTIRLRGHHRMYIEWKRPILIRDGFRCVTCVRGSLETKLAVHHDKERFSVILHRHLVEFVGEIPDRELTWDESTEICERVVDYHLRAKTGSPVSGITLCYDCHAKVHELEQDDD
jgi:hypothetical protein